MEVLNLTVNAELAESVVLNLSEVTNRSLFNLNECPPFRLCG